MAQIRINLLTKDFRSGSALAESGVKVLVGLVLLCFLGIGAWQYVTLANLTASQAGYQTNLDALQRKVLPLRREKAREAGISRLQVVRKNLKTSSPAMYQLILAVQAATPSGVTLDSLSVNTGVIAITLQATDMVQVETMLDSLTATKGFTTVQLETLSQAAGKPVQASLSVKFSKGGWSK
ncbi:MAG: PilN domain-containing protein [Peptococcaceae bacterium]|nr:PilN domain-containing protein [Peptococcaceae bacterium]